MPATPQLSIDWCDPKQKISDYFSVGEALYLPRWERLANEQDGLSDDSKTALAWIKTKKAKTKLEKNQASEIREYENVAKRYISTLGP